MAEVEVDQPWLRGPLTVGHMDPPGPVGYWGMPTSSIDWCETNYAVSHYVAEFWNTISNISFIFFGIYGTHLAIKHRFERRFIFTYLAIIVVGIGSCMFHATLQHSQQQSDETPMVWSMFLWVYIMYADDWDYSPFLRGIVPLGFILYAVVFAFLHWEYRFVVGFQMHFVMMVAVCMIRLLGHYRKCTEPSARRLCNLYFLTLGLGFTFWLLDMKLCSTMQSLPLNPQGHAWWHVVMGANCYLGPAFAQYVRAQQLGLHPTIKYKFGIPYVSTLKLP